MMRPITLFMCNPIDFITFLFHISVAVGRLKDYKSLDIRAKDFQKTTFLICFCIKVCKGNISSNWSIYRIRRRPQGLFSI